MGCNGKGIVRHCVLSSKTRTKQQTNLASGAEAAEGMASALVAM